MKPLKILFVTPFYRPFFEMGGVSKSLTMLAEELTKLGHEITVFTTNSNPLGKTTKLKSNSPINVNGVTVYYFSTTILTKIFNYSPSFKKICFNLIDNFDLVHLECIWSYLGIIAGKAARKHKIPYITSPCGSLNTYALNQKKFRKKLFLLLFEKKNLNSANFIHYSTQLEMESTHAFNNIKTPYFIIPRFIISDEFQNLPEINKAKKDLSIPQDSLIISSIGRLHTIKALDILIKSFYFVNKELSNCYLLIAGPNDGDRKKLKELTNKLGLQNKVRFLGYADLNKKRLIWSVSDIFWFASHQESFGLAGVEAMSCGIPLILSKNVGICKETINDKAGIIVPHNPKKIAISITELLKNKQVLLKMSDNARVSAKKYSKNKNCNDMINLYKTV
jgi:glycosyltransferase involved in cell wall biosynthesis